MKQDVEKEQDATSGAAAINQTLQKKQVPGGDSLEMIMNSRSIPDSVHGPRPAFVSSPMSAPMVTANKMQFETSTTRIKKFGVKGLTDADFEPFYGQWLNKGMEPEEFVRQAVFEIRKGSLLAIEKQDEVQVAFVLRKMGDISRNALFRKIGLSKARLDRGTRRGRKMLAGVGAAAQGHK